uniref:Uncharacterized protein n=1 Tax=Periophthalmus magnuspinnatus TaxID=409849 RepID=A0A3B4B3U7_9GOBI
MLCFSQVEELIKPTTWLDAGAQVFYAFSLAWGGLISFSSYNPVQYDNNCKRDAMILTAITGCTSVYAAMVTYTIIGFRATDKYEQCITHIRTSLWDLTSSRVTCRDFSARYHLCFLSVFILLYLNFNPFSQGVEGTGLVFIVFTEAITKMPGSPIWSVLFFVMLLCLGLSTLIGNIEGVVVPIRDLGLFPKTWPQEALTAVTCGVAFVITLLFAQHSGFYWVTLFDNFAGSVPLLCIGLFEMISVVYIYGVDRFNEDIKFMIGSKPGLYWQVTWRCTSPLIILVILVFYLVIQAQEQLTYLVWDPSSVRQLNIDNRLYVSQEQFPVLDSVPYPSWINAVIFLLAGIPSLTMPIYALCRLLYVYLKKKSIQ